MNLQKVTIHKIKENVNGFEDFVRTETKSKKALPALKVLAVNDEEFPEDIEIEARYAFQEIKSRKAGDNIPWIAFLNSKLSDEDRILFNSSNKFPSAILALRITRNDESEYYAITFGIGGDSFLDSEKTVRDFGIKVAMNICDPNNLKRVQTSIHEAVSTQSERQISAGSRFSVFGINGEREFLRILSGLSDKDYIDSFTGKESISLKVAKDKPLDWAQLVAIATELGTYYNSNAYQERFPDYDKFEVINDPMLIVELNDHIFSNILERNLDKVHLAPPEVYEYDSTEFAYNDDFESSHTDISLEGLLASKRAFRSNASITSIKKMKVYARNVDTNVIFGRWSAYRCLVGEVDYCGNTYVLSLGQWKRISTEFKTEVETYVNNIEVKDFDFLPSGINIWVEKNADGKLVQKNKEAAYNEYVSLSDDLVLFDKAKISIASEKRYEMCDLMHKDKIFVHVKRYISGAASISHLFVQARFYTRAFMTEATTRVGMRKYLETESPANFAQFEPAFPEDRSELHPENYEIVICILSSNDDFDIKSLPFMALYELMYTHRDIVDTFGVKFSICFVTVLLGSVH